MAKMIKAKLNGRHEIILPKHRADRAEWYTEKGWEKIRLESLETNIKNREKCIVFYVGSEESEMPALCQIWGAEVVLFEPNPKVWPNAKAIWKANNLDFPLALFEGFASNVTSENAYEHIYTSEWMPHANEEVIGNHGFKELYLEAENYPQIRLIEMAERLGVKPDIITLDVEGSEFEVLKGAEELLQSDHKPDIYLSLHSEFLIQQWGVHSGDLRRWILDKGYKEELLDFAMHETHLLYRPDNA